MGSDIKVFLVRHGAKKQEAAAAKYPIIEDENAKYFLPKKSKAYIPVFVTGKCILTILSFNSVILYEQGY